MKRTISFILATIFLITVFSSCSPKNKSAMYVVDGAYNLTPQEYIDAMNQHIENQADDRYKTISDFVNSGEEIEILSFRLTVEFETNDDGKISRITYNWDAVNASIITAATMLIGSTIGMISPDDGENVIQSLDMMNPNYPKYSTEAASGETVYKYSVYGYGDYNTLVIEPAS